MTDHRPAPGCGPARLTTAQRGPGGNRLTELLRGMEDSARWSFGSPGGEPRANSPSQLTRTIKLSQSLGCGNYLYLLVAMQRHSLIGLMLKFDKKFGWPWSPLPTGFCVLAD